MVFLPSLLLHYVSIPSVFQIRSWYLVYISLDFTASVNCSYIAAKLFQRSCLLLDGFHTSSVMQCRDQNMHLQFKPVPHAPRHAYLHHSFTPCGHIITACLLQTILLFANALFARLNLLFYT